MRLFSFFQVFSLKVELCSPPSSKTALVDSAMEMRPAESEIKMPKNGETTGIISIISETIVQE